MLEELKAQVPEAVLMLMRVPGLGPKKAAKLYKELGVKTLAELRVACEGHRVQELEGFGAKTEAAILAGMTLAESPEAQRMYWAEADVFAQAILAHLRELPRASSGWKLPAAIAAAAIRSAISISSPIERTPTR